MIDHAIVYIVDDDAQARKSVQTLTDSMGVKTKSFASAEEFLQHYDGHRPGCLVVDVRMIGMSGLELQEKLNEMNHSLSIVVLTAFATTPITVRAMRNGAVTLLEKPCDEDQLWDAIRAALAADLRNSTEQQRVDDARQRIAALTPKESEVLECMVAGDANKVAAGKLGISVRTVEIHRRHVFEKLRAKSLPELVRLALLAAPKASRTDS